MRDQLNSTECSSRLRALAEPARLRIIQLLQDGPRSVGELATLLDDQTANVSHHLGVLRHADLVRAKKKGKFVIYSLNPDVYRGSTSRRGVAALDFGCCRLDLGQRA